MMPYVNPEAMTAVGSKTKQTVIYKSESHKLHQAFPVKKDEVILQGQPVQLNTDGTIQAYFGTGIYLGIAVTDTQYPAYPVGEKIPEVTVMVEAFAIVYGVAGEVMNTCGAVLPNKLDEDRWKRRRLWKKFRGMWKLPVQRAWNMNLQEQRQRT